MRARRPLFVVVLVVGLSVPSFEAHAEDRPQRGVGDPGKPPSITYGGSRSSKTWITKPDGTRVAVGKGVEWKGVRVYLSLLWDLVAVDAASGKVLYAANVGAFWNAIGFKEVETTTGTKVWAVELRPGPRTRVGKDRRQYHDLRSGKKLKVKGAVTVPSGTKLDVPNVWSGAHSRVAKPFRLIVSNAANWKTVQTRMFGTDIPKDVRAVDFKTHVVLVISSGDSWNCRGIGLHSAYEDDKRLLVRTSRHTFQTAGGGQQARPYGIFVLPRRPGKAYVVERNRQGLIGGPALWTESWRLEKLGKPEAELATLPPSTDTRHDQWVK